MRRPAGRSQMAPRVEFRCGLDEVDGGAVARSQDDGVDGRFAPVDKAHTMRQQVMALTGGIGDGGGKAEGLVVEGVAREGLGPAVQLPAATAAGNSNPTTG